MGNYSFAIYQKHNDETTEPIVCDNHRSMLQSPRSSGSVISKSGLPSPPETPAITRREQPNPQSLSHNTHQSMPKDKGNVVSRLGTTKEIPSKTGKVSGCDNMVLKAIQDRWDVAVALKEAVEEYRQYTFDLIRTLEF